MKLPFFSSFSLSAACLLAFASLLSANDWTDNNNVSKIEEGSATEAALLLRGPAGNQLTHRNLKQEIAPADKATLHFSFRIEKGGHPDISIGYSAEQSEELSRSSRNQNSDLFGPQLRIVGRELQLRDGSRFVKMLGSLQEDVTYELWMTVCNQSDHWELSLKTASHLDPMRVVVDGKAQFRFRGSQGEVPLRSLVIRANTGNSSQGSMKLQILDEHLQQAPMAYLLP